MAKDKLKAPKGKNRKELRDWVKSVGKKNVDRKDVKRQMSTLP